MPEATLTGTGVSGSNDTGIWAEAPELGLLLISREGDSLDVSPGVFCTISGLSFVGNFGNEDARGNLGTA